MDAEISVLLVDDDECLLELLGAALQRQGFRLTLASTQVQALRLLETLAFDAVVCDVCLDGDSDGAVVLEAARRLRPQTVVLLITGYRQAWDVDRAVAALKGGALDYLRKPVDPETLGATIRGGLREARLRSSGGELQFMELVDILSEMVANSIERVDPYTAGHGERTRKYCRMLAERCGLERTATERLELAAIAHDYGKIYLDDLGFLTKKGPLTADEYRAVQEHPRLGADKLGGHSQLEDVCQFVAEHHEKWDGTGYPRRLAGEEISLPGRILGVVEVFDSLATRRSYKDVWELPKTTEFFAAQRGKAFDPEVCDLFLELLDEHGPEWMRAPQEDLRAAGLECRG
ncbi:MAG: HD domain-containing phosphohydrolase [Planctomycetota bacterium]|nr:HD domain-containing phosphohydrolase [Planctomycetota bacterium]MDP6761732.1 HD domain-containing phosphohydrolase [Planctomycetota bacterium]MDP6990254.1 HD domain-containing phosphohydrolase [Planctomycetota bacterium]